MAVLRADLSTEPTRSTAPATDLSIRGHVPTTYRVLRRLFGEPDVERPGGDDPALWMLDTPAGQAQIVGPASVGQADVEHGWTIEAASDSPLPWIFKVVTGSTAGFPTGALSDRIESSLASFTLAYIDYLLLRMDAIQQRFCVLDRTDEEYQRLCNVPRQLNSAAVKLRDIPFDYEWSHASPAKRQDWMPRPQPGAYPTELKYWHERGRWLYPPAPTGGDPDLPGMLLHHAETRQRFRDRHLERNPSFNAEVDREIEQTLRALAAAPHPRPGCLLLTRVSIWRGWSVACPEPQWSSRTPRCVR